MSIIKELFCSHELKFVEGQPVYMTKDSYYQRCTLCGKTKKYMPDTFGCLLEEVVACGQIIERGMIAAVK